MRTRPTLQVVGFAAFALTGCDWNSFNSLLDEAPVVVASTPGTSTTSAFVLPLPIPAEAGTSSAARMLVSRTGSDYLAVADFDMNGKVTLTEITERSNLRGSPVLSAAVRADGMILLGVPGFGGGDTPGGSTVSLALTPLPGGGYSSVMQPSVGPRGAMSRVGLGVAAGNVTGVATGDFVVVGDNSVQVVGGDGKTEVAGTDTLCQSVQFGGLTTEFYPFRPVAAGDLLVGGNDEIVVGGRGRVAFLQWNGTATLLCPTNYYLSGGASINFGSSLAVADFGGTGHKDLAVGSPPDKVYVYFGPLDSDSVPIDPTTAPSVTITNRLPNTSFGLRIASYQLPGAAKAQLLVADPGAPAGSFTGKVMLFNVTGAKAELSDADAVATLFDSREDADGGLFGMGLGALTFNPQLCLPGAPVQLVPWATNHRALLTFFNYPGAVSDPRCFALKP